MNCVKVLYAIIFIITAMTGFSANKGDLAPIINFNKAFITDNTNASSFFLKKYSESSSNDVLFRKNVAICLITASVATSIASGLGIGLSIPFFFFMGFLVPLAIMIPCIFALPLGIILGYYGGKIYKEIYDIENEISLKSPNTAGSGPDITLAAFSL